MTNNNIDSVDTFNFLQSLSVPSILYCPNPGNAGDSAIATATYDLLEDANLHYRCVGWDEDFDSSGEVLVYGGGGNLTPGYTQARRFLNKHHQSAKKLIVLPHTVKEHQDLLCKLGDNVVIFCRENKSYEWVRRHTDGPKVYKDDDLAFRLKPADILGENIFRGIEAVKQTGIVSMQSVLCRYAPSLTSWESAVPLKNLIDMNGGLLVNMINKSGSTLYALRTDKEHSGGSVPKNNIDVSLKFNYGVLPPHLARRSTAAALSFFNMYKRVITNRLHGCIMAGLLGKEVVFYSNSYYKNKEVYQFSIRDNFPNVRWRGEWC